MAPAGGQPDPRADPRPDHRCAREANWSRRTGDHTQRKAGDQDAGHAETATCPQQTRSQAPADQISSVLS